MVDFQKLCIDLQSKIYKEVIYPEKKFEINKFKKDFYKYCLEINLPIITSVSVWELDDEELETSIELSTKFIEYYITNIDKKTQEKIISETDNLINLILSVNNDEDENRFTIDSEKFDKIKYNNYEDHYRCKLVEKILLDVIDYNF